MIVRATLTYGCESRTTTSVTERRFTTFYNNCYIIRYGESKLDTNTCLHTSTGMSRKKINKELIKEIEITTIKYYISGQRIHWFGHIMRGNYDNIIKAVMSWKPTEKRPRERPRKRWMDVIEEDLKKIRVNYWRNIIHDWKKLCEVVMAAKTLVE